MPISFLEVFHCPDPTKQDYAARIGYLAQLIAQSPVHRKYPFEYLTRLCAGLQQGNVKLYFNSEGLAVGFVAWAYLTRDTERRLIKTGELQISPIEWNEGHSLWIVDLAAPLGNIRYILDDLRDQVFRSARTVRYFRKRRDGLIFKEANRESSASFFKKESSHRVRCDCGDISCPAFRG